MAGRLHESNARHAKPLGLVQRSLQKLPPNPTLSGGMHRQRADGGDFARRKGGHEDAADDAFVAFRDKPRTLGSAILDRTGSVGKLERRLLGRGTLWARATTVCACTAVLLFSG
jgi:hypothetical protein